MSKLYGYCRVSTADQANNFSFEAQKVRLIEYGVSAENIIEEVFTGTSVERPELTKILKTLKPNDSLVVVRLDRFARSTLEALTLITNLKKKGVNFISLDLPQIENPLLYQFFQTILLLFSEFEHTQRKIRQAEGIQLAKLKGRYKGRKSKITPELLKKINYFIFEKKLSKTDTARLLGVSRSTIYKGIKNLKK